MFAFSLFFDLSLVVVVVAAVADVHEICWCC